MSQVRLIINVSDQEHSHSNGLSGTYIIPAKKPGEEFGLLVVYPQPEFQDVGNNVKAVHWPKVGSVAQDIVGLRSDACAHTSGSPGSREKWGILLAAAEPDMPKELLQAQEEEIAFLNDNPPDYRMKKDRKLGIAVAVSNDPPEMQAKKEALSLRVQALRAHFEQECRKLVTKKELQQAKTALTREDARLVSEADVIWGGPEPGRVNITEIHKRACNRLGQERPWCYLAQQLVDCPGCGAKIKENILSCPHCAGFLEEGIEELRALKPKDRAMKMYPERYAEPIQPSGRPQARA